MLNELAGSESLTADEQDRVAHFQAVTAGIHSRIRGHAEHLADALREAGVEVRALQYPHAGVDGGAVMDVSRPDAVTAIGLLEREGLLLQNRFSPGGVRARVYSGSELTLIPPQGPISRLIVKWEPKRAMGTVARMFVPSVADLESAPFPSWLWWAYWVARPPLAVLRRLSQRGRPGIRAPYVSTPKGLVRPLLELVSASSSELVLDIGCGDGRVLIEAATSLGCRGVGIESNRDLAEVARSAVDSARLSEKVAILHEDAAQADYSQADVAFLFLPVSAVNKLLPRLVGSMKPGGRIIAHEQSPADWAIAPTRTELVVDPAGITIAYVWESTASSDN